MPGTLLLVALNVAAFAAAVAGGVPLLDPPPDALVQWGANIGPLTADGQPWRVLTGAFVHFGLLHLAVNMLALADLGRIAERLFGTGAFLFIALASGAIAGAVSVAWNPWVHSAGSSGVVFGVLGALLAYGLLPGTRMPPSVLRTQWIVAAGFVAFAVGISFAGVGVDHAAHLGGLASGAVLGALLARPLAPSRPPPSPLRIAAAAGVAVAAVATPVALWRNVGPDYAEEQRFVAVTRAYLEGERERVAALRASFNRWRAGEITRQAHVRDLRAYARLLVETADALDAFRLSADSPSGGPAAQETFGAVLRLRAKGIERRATAIEKGNAAAGAEAERILAEAEAQWERAACVERRSPLLRCVHKPADAAPK